MLGSGKLQVGGTGVGGDGTGNPPTTGADEAVPDACVEPDPPDVVVSDPAPAVVPLLSG